MLYWLAFRQGRLRTVMIVCESLLDAAKMRVDLAVPGVMDHFLAGHELDSATADKVPESAIGWMMTEEEAYRLIERLEGGGSL